MSERLHPFPFLHHALKKISCFSNAGVLQTVSLGENQVSLGKSRTPAMRVRERPWRRSCLRLTAWKEELLEVCCDPGTEPLSNTRPCFENTDVNKMMPLYCWEIHSLVVDRDFFFFKFYNQFSSGQDFACQGRSYGFYPWSGSQDLTCLVAKKIKT